MSPSTAADLPSRCAIRLRGLLDGIFEWAGRVAALFILAIFLSMLFASVGRVAGWRTDGVNEIAAWSCAAASFFAMAHAFKHGDFVRVTLMLDKVTPAVRRALEITSLAIAAVAASYMAWWAAHFTYESWQFNEMAGGVLVIPMWIPQLSFVIGSILFVVAVIDELVVVMRGGKPTYVRMVEERRARGDYFEDV